MQLADLLKEHGIPFWQAGEHHHVCQGWLGIDCFWCSPGSGKARLGYSLEKGFFNCWSCGFRKTREVLREITGKDAFIRLDQGKCKEKKIPHREKLVIPSGVRELLPAHLYYLRERGFDPETVVRLWGVRGIGTSGKLAWRLWIPFHSGGEIVSWTTRAIGSVQPRYLCARPEEERVSAKDLLYGEDYVRHAVVVTEGPTDTWRIGPGSVSTSGLLVSTAQVERLARYPVRVICFDSEDQAQKKARELCDRLAVFPGRTVNVVLESGKDPAEASEREIGLLRRLFLE